MQKIRFEKNALDLEHRKLLSEYNALLVAMASVTLGIAGLIYTLVRDMYLSLIGLSATYIILDLLRSDKSNELNKKAAQIRNL